MDAIRELKAIRAQLKRTRARAKAITAQEASDDDCCCEYCMDLHAILEGIENTLHFAAGAIDVERARRKLEAESN